MTEVVLSNGFGQFHLRGLAESLDREGLLDLFISGALPPRGLERVKIPGSPAALRRLVERSVAVAPERIVSLRRAEVLNQASQRLRARGRLGRADTLAAMSLDVYGRGAAKAVKLPRGRADVYHFRAGYGGDSLYAARARDMRIICDHSIVAPGVIDSYVPQAPPTRLMPHMWQRIQADIDRADAVVANSYFVAETFAESGYDPSRVFVAFTPVDSTFASLIDRYSRRARASSVPRITFAGTAEFRKGIDTVVRTIELLGAALPAEWQIVGDWAAHALEWKRNVPSFVELTPKVSRAELARVLSDTDVFFFPTRAEGSARVVAEALRAGCQVVTTRMAGSAARAGLDGRILDRADDIDQFASAITELVDLSHIERARRRAATRAFATERLSVERYVGDVRAAYEAVRSA